MSVEKPVSKEEEYFLKQNQEKINNLRGEMDQKRLESEAPFASTRDLFIWLAKLSVAFNPRFHPQ